MTHRQPAGARLDERTLAQSAVAANCAMIRESQRDGAGPGYTGQPAVCSHCTAG